MKNLILLTAVLALFAVGCDDDDDGGNLCQSFGSKMDSCGLLSDGVYDCSDYAGTTEDVCRGNCLMGSSCDELEATFCTATPDADLVACMNACDTGDDEFDCGDGETVPMSWVCDGEDDCADGSDEAGCVIDMFVCDDGEEVYADYECDGEDDCADGSD